MSRPPNRKSLRQWTCLLLSAVALTVALPPLQSSAEPNDTSFCSAQWGGHVRAIGTLSRIDDESLFAAQETGPYWDGQGELRLKNDLFLGKRLRLETHYELVNQTGDSLEVRNRLGISSASGITALLVGQAVDDDRRLMSLTRILDDGGRHVAYHRLDRLNLTYNNSWGTLRLGRQALTWGNGLIFNPVDLFNPFAPTTVLRDYKAGDDMALLQIPLGTGEAEFLYLPRRDPETGDLSDDQSSYASKWHFAAVGMEIDFMAARHFKDLLFGAGVTGYMGGAAWRFDSQYTLLDNDDEQTGFWQIVANMDYAWGWFGKNIYGLFEYYYNGLGYTDNYHKALADPVLSDRLLRGELFGLGRHYLAGQLQIELHPLLQSHWSAIVNLSDSSLIFQPQLMWDMALNWQLIAGATLYSGGHQTEYGGFDASVGFWSYEVTPSDSFFLWLTYYF
jgi:hypothetical protein